MKLPSLSLITHHNRNIARTVMLMATLFFGWRMASLLWLLAGQDRADLAKPTLAPVTSNVAVVDGSRLATFSIFKVSTPVSASDAANAPDTPLLASKGKLFVRFIVSDSKFLAGQPYLPSMWIVFYCNVMALMKY